MSPAAIVIRWIGQACFLLTLPHAHVLAVGGTPGNAMIPAGHTALILIDPPHPEVGYAIAAHSIPADAVFISHEHFDHNFVDAAISPTLVVNPLPGPNPPEVTSPASKDPVGLRYKQIFAYHDNVHGALRGPDTITAIDTNGLSIVHLGDLGELALTPEQVKAIGHVDILMIPVGGFYTIDGPQAAAIVAQLHPRVIIPMHYGTPALNADLRSKLAPATAFLDAMRSHADIVTVGTRDLTLSRETLPKRQTVYVLRYE